MLREHDFVYGALIFNIGHATSEIVGFPTYMTLNGNHCEVRFVKALEKV